MRYAKFSHDVVEGLVTSDPLTPEFMELPAGDARSIRLVDGRPVVVPPDREGTFYVDAAGIKHVVRGIPSWQKLQCRFGDDLVIDSPSGNWRVQTASEGLAPHIKRECRKRIYAVLKDTETATNLLALQALAARAEAKGDATPAEKAAADLVEQGVAWIDQMRETSRALIAAADADYASADKWPSPPEGLKTLADEV